MGAFVDIVFAGGVWILEDQRSKNGSFVNGKEVDRHALNDGDIVELGHTFLVFRAAARAADDWELPPHPSLATVNTDLAAGLSQLARIATSEVSVVLRGESGTGKEVMARAVHELSGRQGKLIAVNCGALVESLVQSELFGYRKGAFSGAEEDRKGLVRAAEGGTLFLDEIGDMPASAQAVLLRVLQENEVKPLGATDAIAVDVRVVSATHRDLDAMIDAGDFRADLFARLSGFEFSLKPLRARSEDLGLLTASLLRRELKQRADDVAFSPEAARAMFLHDWPLNVRQLEKCLARSVVLAGDDEVALEHLPRLVQESLTTAPDPTALPDRTAAPRTLSPEDEQARDQVIAALRRHNGNVSAVARDLAKDRKQIHRWIKRFGIDLDPFRNP